MSRKIPTRAELDRAEQSVTRIRADLERKRDEVMSLKQREAFQAKVGRSKLDLCAPELPFFFRVNKSRPG